MTKATARILIVEDEIKLLSYLTEMLEEANYSVTNCSSVRELKRYVEEAYLPPHLIVLDRLLSGIDSAESIPQIKTVFPDTKVMVLSALNTAAEKASTLDLGADDYLGKPFSRDELIARTKVLLRRSSPELKLGNVVLCSVKRKMFIGEKEVPLQNREFILLQTLFKTPRKILNKAYLYEKAWEVNSEIESNVIETTVSKLRRRLEEAQATIKLRSMRNKGYWVEE